MSPYLLFPTIGTILALVLYVVQNQRSVSIARTCRTLWFSAALSAAVACGYCLLLNVPVLTEIHTRKSVVGLAIMFTIAASLLTAIKKATHAQ